jgi:hypothetical protein
MVQIRASPRRFCRAKATGEMDAKKRIGKFCWGQTPLNPGESWIRDRTNRSLWCHFCRTRAGSDDATADLSAEAPDVRLARAIRRRRLTLAVSNRLGDVQREYRRNGYAKVKSHKTTRYFRLFPGFYPFPEAGQIGGLLAEGWVGLYARHLTACDGCRG